MGRGKNGEREPIYFLLLPHRPSLGQTTSSQLPIPPSFPLSFLPDTSPITIFAIIVIVDVVVVMVMVVINRGGI